MAFYRIQYLFTPLSHPLLLKSSKDQIFISSPRNRVPQYKSHLYYALGDQFLKQHHMFSECEFEKDNSITFKQLGSSDSYQLRTQCANIYVRYRLLASGFFQIGRVSSTHFSKNKIKYSEYSFYAKLFNLWKKYKYKHTLVESTDNSLKSFWLEVDYFKVGWEFKLLFWLNTICFFLPRKCAFGD